MIIFFITSLIIIFFIVILLFYCIRYYDTKEIIFRLLAIKYKVKNVVFYKKIKIDEMSKILSLTTKGKFIEYNIATPAWFPIISLESSDNKEWEFVKKNFIYFMTKTKLNSNSLPEIIRKKIEKMINGNIKIDSVWISKIVVDSLCEIIFCTKLNSFQLDLFYKGSIEWRKELAMKGFGNSIIKYKCVDEIINLIKSNENIYNIFEEKWYQPEFYSVIMQPFIISPMINIPDIMVNYVELIEKNKISLESYITNDLINFVIYSYHPFPILERYDSLTNTQYFIPLDNLTNSNNYSSENKLLVFGVGNRKCAGINFAYDILRTFFTLYAKYPNSFAPRHNHLYSGRNNDKFVFSELFYMLTIIIKIFCN